MFAARGVALGLGGSVNFNDLRNLTQQRTNGQTPLVRKNVDVSRQRKSLPETTIMGSKKKKKQKKARIVVKKSLDKSTFWSVCRAIVFGVLLMGLGAAMSTLGYYKEHFATETVRTGNSTENRVNPSTRLQFESLSYIGPCVMGIGAFVLMIACVMTLEGREMNIEVYQPRIETTCSRVALATAVVDNLLEPTAHDGPPKYTDPDPNNNRDINSITPADQEETGSGGNTNKCYTMEDSKSASTTTTTLTWSKNAGLKCEPADQMLEKACKYPSASCIDVLMNKTQDARALLQRFLEDESRLVERRIDRFRRKKHFASSYLTNQSASLDISDSEKINFMKRCVKSDEIPSKCDVVAEVHHCGLGADSPEIHGFTSVTLDSPFSGSAEQWSKSATVPVTHDESYSPMSLLSTEQSPNLSVVNENFYNYYSASPKQQIDEKTKTSTLSTVLHSLDVDPLGMNNREINGNEEHIFQLA